MTVYINGNAKTEIYYNGAVMEKAYANGVLVHTRATHNLLAADVSGFAGANAIGYQIAGTLTPNTFEGNYVGALYTDPSHGSIQNGTYGPILRVLISNATSQNGTWSNLAITGTFNTGTHTQTYTPADTKSFFQGDWYLYNTGGKGFFVVGNTYLINWT
jgi:hypothetical protein